MSTPFRTLKYLRRIGIKEYAHQMMNIGDTKAGTLIGTDRFGNKFYENNEEELPLRTKWVDYKEWDYDASQIEPGWHAWLHYMTDKHPNVDPNMIHERKPWEKPNHIPNVTFTRSAYKPYSTTVTKISEWQAVAKPRTA